MTSTYGRQQRADEPCRQVHLDFHTSEHIPGVGSLFDRRQWQEALKLGRVNLINTFAKCHHSWCYYPTKVGRMHPSLTFDLLGEQIAACHEIGVKAPIYLTVGWSATEAEEHPEWCQRNRDGSYAGFNLNVNAAPGEPRPPCSWKSLCPNSSYHEHVMAHAEELCRGYDVDGLWLDIYYAHRPCWCESCLKGMREAGVDWRDEEAAKGYQFRVVSAHQAKVKALLHSHHPGASIYFNGTTASQWLETFGYGLFVENTKNDLEDLPTTWGGYNKFPLRARLFHAVGKPIVAMSGKFHTWWGEFGGFKHPDALRYEAACMIANGARCNFGDQMHPAGRMDLATYANIGRAYEYVEQIEEFGVPGRPVSNLALWYTRQVDPDEGAAAMLLETQTEFETLYNGWDIPPHIRTIVVPGVSCLGAADVAALEAFLARGGALLAMGGGALDAAGRPLPGIGADSLGPARFVNDYTRVEPVVGADLPATPFLNYEAALRFAPAAGTQVLAVIHEPYFDRTYGAYCSHQNTPNRLEAAEHPAAFRCGNVITIAHDLSLAYRRHGARVHRQFFANCLALLHTAPMVQATMPSSGRVTLLHQPHENRYVAHLTYASPIQRGRCEIIEDIVPLRDVPLAVRLSEKVKRVYTVPGRADLATRESGGALHVTLPRLECHAAVVFEY